MHKPTTADMQKIYEMLPRANVIDTGWSKVTVLGWFRTHNPIVEVRDEYALLRVEYDDKGVNISPLATSPEAYKAAVTELESMGFDSLRGANAWQAEILKEMGYEVTLDRDASEYLYLPEDLIELKGQKFHSKRNFINRFDAEYTFRPYTSGDYDGLMKLLCMWSYRHIDNGVRFCEQEGWIKYKDLEKVEVDEEILVLDGVVKDLKGYNCYADVLVVNDEIVGFAAGETMPNGIGALYFEKANIDYRGIYPLLDNLFCKAHFGEVKYINKQEDMGIEGLRKSKLSYNPVAMAERYTAVKK